MTFDPVSHLSASTREFAILIVDDEAYFRDILAAELSDAGFRVTCAGTPKEALEASRRQQFSAAVVDIMMPGADLGQISTWGGFRTGQALARALRAHFPEMKIIGFSLANDEAMRKWFNAQPSMAFLLKQPDAGPELVELLRNMLLNRKREPRIFIVHGRDTKLLLELKNFIQNSLHLGEPIILAEQPSSGRTIVEKFEEYSSLVDIAFVLLTPDDVGSLSGNPLLNARARQNAIFELGYFAGLLGRRSGKILVLVKDHVEIPSDLHGIAYIEIKNGIAAATEEIRRELREWL